jgi:hypothetical protein
MSRSGFFRRAAVALAMVLCAATALLPAEGRAAAAPKAETYYLFVFSNPVTGREDEYNKWYDNQPAADVISVPGFVSAQHYAFSDVQLRSGAQGPARNLFAFKIVTRDLPAVYIEVNRRLKEGTAAPGLSFDGKTARMYTFRAITPVMKGARARNLKSKREQYAQFFFGTANEGKDEDFNEWYNKKHAPAIASIHGFETWQRYTLNEIQLATPGPTEGEYLVVYNVLTSDVKATFEEVQKALPKMDTNPGDSGKILNGYTYKAIGPLVSADQVRAMRAKKPRKRAAEAA